jgi:hypothetical protein
MTETLLTSSTSTTPIWGEPRSIPKVFSQYGTSLKREENISGRKQQQLESHIFG